MNILVNVTEVNDKWSTESTGQPRVTKSFAKNN